MQEMADWFRSEGVEWVVANGDLALSEFDLEQVYEVLASFKLPTLVMLGNSDSQEAGPASIGNGPTNTHLLSMVRIFAKSPPTMSSFGRCLVTTTVGSAIRPASVFIKKRTLIR